MFRRFLGLKADDEVWDATTFSQATLNVDLGLCNMEHLEIGVRVIVSLIAKLQEFEQSYTDGGEQGLRC